MRVLIIDDDPATRTLVQHRLQADGRVTHVAQAATAEEAVALAETGSYDVMLVDLLLGVQDGVQLLGPLRLASPNALLAVLTGMPTTTVRDGALQAGADLFLPKSSTPYSQLADHLAAALSERRSVAEGGPL